MSGRDYPSSTGAWAVGDRDVDHDGGMDIEVAAETYRIYRTSRWIAPLGSSAAALVLVLELWGRLSHGWLIGWFVAALCFCLCTIASFSIPHLAKRRLPNGIPVVTTFGHAGIGIAFGVLPWLMPEVVSDPVALWTMAAGLFAISAGVAFGLAGLNLLGLCVIVPMWVLAGGAFLMSAEYTLSFGVVTFAALVVAHQLKSGAQWRELVVLRVRETRQAEVSAWRASHDDLTGLLNRSGVTALLEPGTSAATALFVDLDHFKEVNDRFGHACGDVVLNAVAERLQSAMPEAMAIARIGGDEFFAVFEGELADDHVRAIGERVINLLEEPFAVGAQSEAWISASVGFTRVGRNSFDASRLMVESDHAMLQAKRSGRRQVAGFTGSLERELEARSGLESALRKAVRAGEIRCAVQPIFDLQTRTVRGVEFLARWSLPGGSAVPPSIFIPLCEEVGLIDQLTDQMLAAAGEWLSTWKSEPLLQHAYVAVNVSPVQVAKGRLLETVAEAIERHAIEPGALVLELTESATLSEMTTTAELFGDLRTLGVGLAVDDFGSGYSSLGHLLGLPLTTVKIDQSLIAGVGADSRRQAVMVAIRDLATVLGHEVVAEGVETSHQADVLLAMGIHGAQGFGLCRPVAPEDLVEQLELLGWAGVEPVSMDR